MLKLFYLFFVILLVFTENLSAKIIEVPNNCSTIQEAVDSAMVNEDTVLVHPGIYYENIVIPITENPYSRIVLLSKYYFTGDEQYISNTIIDGSRIGSIMNLRSKIFEITGFTFQNGKSDDGGALHIEYYDSTQHHIKKCIFKNNEAYKGGVFFAYSTSLKIDSCLFVNNKGTYGGVGFSQNKGNIYFSNSIFRENQAVYGGAFYTTLSSNSTFFRCRLYNNTAEYSGGALFIDGKAAVNLIGTSIHHNSAANQGGGIQIGGSFPVYDLIFDTERSNIYSNEAPIGKDIYHVGSSQKIIAHLDTFSVCEPIDLYTYPAKSFILDVLNPLIPCSSSNSDTLNIEWERCNVPQAADLDLTVVDFYDSRNGYIGTAGGEYLLKTKNQAESWEIVPTNISDKHITHMRFWNEQEGVLLCENKAGDRSFLLKTNDGGYTWENIAIPETIKFTLLIVFDKNNWYISAAETYYSYYTSDAGEYWGFFADGPDMMDLCSVSDTISYGVNGQYSVYRSIDYGHIWSELFSIQYPRTHHQRCSFVSESWGIIASKTELDYYPYAVKGTLNKVLEKNGTWYYSRNHTYSSIDGQFKKVLLFTENLGYVLSTYRNEILLKTIDGGESWKKSSLADSFQINDIYKIPNENIGVIVGNNGLILIRKGSTPPRYPANINSAFIEGFPNPASGQILIDYFIPDAQKITITIYNVLGQKISKILDKQVEQNGHRLIYNVKDLAGGIYFLVLKTKHSTAAHKIVVLH